MAETSDDETDHEYREGDCSCCIVGAVGLLGREHRVKEDGACSRSGVFSHTGGLFKLLVVQQCRYQSKSSFRCRKYHERT